MKIAKTILISALVSFSAVASATAQAPEFKAKELRLVIGYAAGGGNDLFARLVGRHLVKQLPGRPIVIPQNMTGAASLLAATHIYSVAPKDGSVIGLISSALPAQLLVSGKTNPNFDASKVTWIGSPTYASSVCATTSNAKVKDLKQLMTEELVVGALGPGSTTEMLPTALNGIIGTRFKVVKGYASAPEILLAMDRGEVDGMCTTYSAFKIDRSDDLASGKLKILFEASSKASPEVKAPFLLDEIQNVEQRQALEFIFSNGTIGRPFIAPPDLPQSIVATLRGAFDATMKDPDFLQEAEKLKFDIEPVSGLEIEKLIHQIHATPKTTIEKVKKVLGDQAGQ